MLFDFTAPTAMIKRYFLSSICLVWLGGPAFKGAFAQKPNSTEPIDRVLDLLEKKLLDRDQKSGFSEVEPLDPSGTQPVKSYRFTSPGSVGGIPPESAQINSIKTDVRSLQQKVEQIESSVSKLKQTIVLDSNVDAYIELVTIVVNNPDAQLRKLQIKLDELILYDIAEAAVLWNFNEEIPIYYGPLKSGSHRLQVDARLTLPGDTALIKVSTRNNLEISKVFDIQIPLGTSQNKFILELEAPVNVNGKPTASLKEAI